MIVSAQNPFLQISLPKVIDSFGKWFEKHPTAIPGPLPVLLSAPFSLKYFHNAVPGKEAIKSMAITSL